MSKHWGSGWDEQRVKEHNERIRRGRAVQRDSASTIANMEQHTVNAAQVSNEIKTVMPRVVIRFSHYRKRFADVDNFCTKYFVDGLVKNGVLLDDSPKEVEEVRHRQIKIEQWQEEKTVIELIRA